MKRVFIVGCPRSGTTLLQSILIKNKTIISFPETHFFTKLFLHDKGRKYPVLYGNYILFNLFKQFNKENNINLKFFPQFSKERLVEKFVKDLDDFAKRNNKKVWIEKTPSHLYVIDEISNFIKDALFIHVIRNGLDVVASLYEVTNKYSKIWNTRYTIDDAINRYNKDIEITKKYLNFGLSNHIIVKYEDILDNKEMVLERLSDFLKIRNDFSNNPDINLIISKNERWKELNKKREIVDTRLKKFKKIFSKAEQKYILKRINKDFYEKDYFSMAKI